MRRNAIRAGLAAAVTGVLVLTGAVGAEADDLAYATETTSVAMAPSGFDAAVAEANGYRVITGDDGKQRSVAVSPEAIAFERALERSRTTYVSGPCGNSWINAVSRGNSKFISTGYVVPRPVIAKNWTVQVWGWSGMPSHWWGGATGPSWSSSWSFSMPGDGFANVVPGSNVVMSDGTVCASGSPGENFHS
jgi:hypothetical protein